MQLNMPETVKFVGAAIQTEVRHETNISIDGYNTIWLHATCFGYT